MYTHTSIPPLQYTKHTNSAANAAAFTVLRIDATVYLWISMQADHQNALKHGIYSFVISIWLVYGFFLSIHTIHTAMHSHTHFTQRCISNGSAKLPNSSIVPCTPLHSHSLPVYLCVYVCGKYLQQTHVSRKWFTSESIGVVHNTKRMYAKSTSNKN